MTNNIILVGAAASGKDYLRKKLIEKGYTPSISITSRPPRIGEIDGIDYIFKTIEQCQDLSAKDFFLEYCRFNDWFYGTPKDDSKNLYIMTPGGVRQLPVDFRKQSTIIFLDMPEELRLERLKSRNDNADSLERRIIADREDFKDFKDWDLRITSVHDINL